MDNKTNPTLATGSDAQQEAKAPSPLTPAQKREQFLKLIEPLGPKNVVRPALSSEWRAAQLEQLQRVMGELNLAYVRAIREAMDVFCEHKALIAHLKKHRVFANINFTEHSHHLLQMEFEYKALVKMLDEVDFDSPSKGFLNTLNRLKVSVRHYHSEFMPLMQLISHFRVFEQDKGVKLTIKKVMSRFGLAVDIDPLIQLKKLIDTVQPNYREHLNRVSETITIINTLLYDDSIANQVVMEISQGLYNSSQMNRIAQSMLWHSNITFLMQDLRTMLDALPTKEKIRLFKFLHMMVKQFALFDVDGQSPWVLKSLERFNACCQSEREHAMLNKIMQTLRVVSAKKQASYRDFLEHLKGVEVDGKRLTCQLQWAIDDYHLGSRTLRSVLVLTYDIMTQVSPDIMSEPELQPVQELIKQAMKLAPFSSYPRVNHQLSLALSKTILNKSSTMPAWAVLDYDPVSVNEHNPEPSVWEGAIEKAASGQLTKADFKAHAKSFATDIRNHMKLLFADVTVPLLKQSFWHDKQKETFEQLTPLIDFEQKFQYLIADTMLYQVQSPKTLRQDPKQVMQLYDFFVHAYEHALEQGWFAVSELLYRSLFEGIIKDMDLPRPKMELVVPGSVPVELVHFDQLPTFERLQEKIHRLKNSLPKLQQYLVLGKIGDKLEHMQQRHQKMGVQPSKMNREIDARLFCWPQDSWQAQLLRKSGKQALSTIYTKTMKERYMTPALVEKASFNDLIKLFEHAIAHDINPLFIQNGNILGQQESMMAIVHHLKEKLSKTTSPPTPKLLFQLVLKLTSLVNKETFFFYEQVEDFMFIWHVRMEQIIKKEMMDQKKIKLLLSAPLKIKDWIPEVMHDFVDLRRLENKSQSMLSHILSLVEADDAPYSDAYIRTLSSYLEGTQFSQIQVPSHRSIEDQAKMHYDFEDMYEEEADPSIIGVAETWNVFKAVAQSQIAGPPFSYDNIKKTYLDAFSWAISSDIYANTKLITDNLLNVVPNIALDIQRHVLDMVTITMDTIGKLAGPKSEYILYNLNEIDHLITTLADISEAMNDSTKLHNPQYAAMFNELVSEQKQSALELNARIRDRLASGDMQGEHYSPNRLTHEFLQMNEDEYHRHLKAEMDDYDPSRILPEMTMVADTNHAIELGGAPNPNFSSYEAPEDDMDDWDRLAKQVDEMLDQQEDSFMAPESTDELRIQQ